MMSEVKDGITVMNVYKCRMETGVGGCLSAGQKVCLSGHSWEQRRHN